MENPNKKVGQGCFNVLARTIVVRLISVAVVLGLAVFSCAVTFAVASVKGSTFGLITGVIFFAALLFGGAFVFVFITIYRRKSYLDKAFVPIGLEGSVYHLWFRRYEGQIQGRKVEVYFHRGPDLQIFIETNLKTRMGASPAYADTMFFAIWLIPRRLNTISAIYKTYAFGPMNRRGFKIWSPRRKFSRSF